MPSSACACVRLVAPSFPTRRSSDLLERLREWAPGVSDETLGSPRIVLLASEFSATVTNLALFLYGNGMQPYKTLDGRYVVTVSTILDRKSTRLNSSHGYISYAVFCLCLRPPRCALFPYTTLFRSAGEAARVGTGCI